MILVPNDPVNRARGLQIYGAIREAGREALAELAKVAVADVKQRLSVPVEWNNGHAIRSSPGEPPRLDTGELEDNVRGEVWVESDSQGADIISSRPASVQYNSSTQSTQGSKDSPYVPMILEFEINRPYMRPSLEEMKSIAPQIIAKILKQ